MRFVVVLLVLTLCGEETVAADCACATVNVHVRDGAGVSHTILTTLLKDHCLTFKGNRQTVSGSSWVNVNYNGKVMRFVVVLLVLTLCGEETVAADCACATVNVHVRDGAGVSHTILTTLLKDHCLTFKGNRQTVSGSSWVNVNYNGKDGWIHEGYVRISPCSGSSPLSSSNVQLTGCPTIITRAEWGARAPSTAHAHLPATPKYMFIHHGASAACYNKTDCIHKVQQYQNYHMDGHGWADIGYSFVVGEDGNVYEARGWDSVGAHTYGYNSVGLAICVIGDFTDHVPNEKAQNAVKQMINCAAANGKITSNYILRGHRDMGQTACPGTKFYDLIKTWPHY